MEKIDNLDRKILGILSKNARIPFKDVAAECGVSRAAIHQRVQHLMEDGFITGSGFDVNPKSLGYSTCTYVGLNLERGNMYKKVVERLQENPAAYDKGGEMHYDIISAFIKSIRGSDPDAAIYWLARMVAGGEDPEFIARRLVISASEDIGLANPNALLLANACFDALKKIGWPEGRIILAETTVYLACSPKSNSAYMAINDALELVNRTGNLPVPLHLRNAPTKLMAELNYGKDYKYAHDYENHFVKQEFLPKEILNERLWKGQENPSEHKLIEQMRRLWGDRY